jgi:8-hydroxy-5-deazaflavin:NADPH oxidoreductase
MTVGIAGAGRMGRALAGALEAAGVPVLLAGVREAVPFEELWWRAGVVLLTLPFPVALDLMRGVAGRCGGGRTMVDVTNPRLSASPPTGPGGLAGRSGGELIAEAARTWEVAKAFNTVPAGALGGSRVDGCPVSLPVAGTPAAKFDVCRLARRLGFDPVDAGDISGSRELESLAVLLMRVSDANRLHGRIAIHIGQPAGFAAAVT